MSAKIASHRLELKRLSLLIVVAAETLKFAISLWYTFCVCSFLLLCMCELNREKKRRVAYTHCTHVYSVIFEFIELVSGFLFMLFHFSAMMLYIYIY